MEALEVGFEQQDPVLPPQLTLEDVDVDVEAGGVPEGAHHPQPHASCTEARKPSASSCALVCALPTTKSPLESMTIVSVMVPPASMARIRGSRMPPKLWLYG